MKPPAALSLLLSVLMMHGCQSISGTATKSPDTPMYIGVEPSAQEPIEALLANFEASQGLYSATLVVGSPQEMIAAIERGEVDCGFILGMPGQADWFSVSIGDESLSVIVPANSVVQRISNQTLAEIFIGRITNWLMIGGPDERIVAISPSPGSAIHQILTARLMGAQDFGPTGLVSSSDSESIRLVSQTPGSISIVRSASVTSAVRPMEIEENQSESGGSSYELTALRESIYFVADREPTGETRQLLNWILSPVGQRALSNFVDAPPH